LELKSFWFRKDNITDYSLTKHGYPAAEGKPTEVGKRESLRYMGQTEKDSKSSM